MVAAARNSLRDISNCGAIVRRQREGGRSFVSGAFLSIQDVERLLADPSPAARADTPRVAPGRGATPLLA